jgi:hypothetical protein
MAKSKFEEMFDRLPSNIKETEVLRLESKKVLAALLELLLHSEAKETRVIYAPNSRLRKLSGIDAKKLLPSIEQLLDYDLITRKVGKVRNKDEKGEASEYTINFMKLKKPLVEKTFDDLFSEFLEDEESIEMPINTAITTTISNTTSTLTTTPNSISSSTINSTSTENTSSIVNVSSTSSQIQEQNQMELEKPNNYRDLMEYFKKRMIEECKDKNLDELNEIQESLKDELDSFNEIKGYKDIYRYLIIPSIEKKKDKLLTKDF